MKTFLTLVLSLLFAFNAIGQSDNNGFTNKAEAKNLMLKGVREGKWIIYKDSNEKKTADTNAPYYALMVFNAGIAVGVVRQYYRSGKLLSEGTENGIERWYYEDGKLQAEVPYINGHKNGVEKWYYESGKLQYETPNTDDKTNGIKKEYYESGALKAEYPFKDDVENGTEKEYYESGKIKTETPFINGVAGDSNSYDENWNDKK